MPRSRHKSAQIVRTSTHDPSTVAHEVEPRLPPLHASLVLRRATSRRLSDFQRAHVEYPPLHPLHFRTVWVSIVEQDLRPVLRPDGQPHKTRVFLELALQDYTRRPRWGMRPRPVWFLVAWNLDGLCLYKARRRSRKGVGNLYKVPASRFRVARTNKGHALVCLPDKPAQR